MWIKNLYFNLCDLSFPIQQPSNFPSPLHISNAQMFPALWSGSLQFCPVTSPVSSPVFAREPAETGTAGSYIEMSFLIFYVG